MENKEVLLGEYYSIDLMHLIKVLIRKAWILMVCGVISAGIGFSYSAFILDPTYSSTIKLYVNNNDFSLGSTSFNISSSDISASRSLVSTYGEILNNRTTLERVIEKTAVSYTYKELSQMISYGSSNNTEIMFVKVTTGNPYEASTIANCIAEVLPTRISEIIEGATMEVVDSAIPNLSKVGPSISKYTAIGLFLGIFLAAAVIVVLAILDDTIHDEDYIINKYDYPILAKVPDLMSISSSKNGYYYKSRSKSSN